MKIQILSDLHLGCYKQFERYRFLDSLRSKEADITLIAGDVGVASELEEYISDLCSIFKKIIYVQGNHSLWNSSFSKNQILMEKIQSQYSNLEWLENRRIEINGQGIIGCTLWYSINHRNLKLFKNFADGWMIQDGYPNIDRAHKKSIEFLEANIKEGDIVLSHHAPSFQSVHNKFLGNPYNCFFFTDQEKIIKKCKPKFWIHGHTHTNFDYMIDKTRIICNPSAYPGENTDFNPNLIIEV